MADFATYIGATPKTIQLTAVAVGRGLRVSRAATGLCSVTGIGTRGDYVTMVDGAASERIAATPAGTPAKVPAVASVAVAVGDLAYSAADGKFSNVATGAVLMGRWTMEASGDGVLGEVELFTTA